MAAYIFAETAFSHQGSVDYLLELVDELSSCDVQAIKYQVLIDANELVSSCHPGYEQIADWCLSMEQWQRVFQATRESGKEIIMMPLDVDSLRLLDKFEVSSLELHSVLFGDDDFLAAMRDTGLPVILGVGGRTLDEIDKKIHQSV